MSDFTFPQPGERHNAAAVPVPVHTLVALLAAALAWETDSDAAYPNLVPPQIADATLVTLAQLPEEIGKYVILIAERLVQERADEGCGV